jgi:ankyrin repeat protein
LRNICHKRTAILAGAIAFLLIAGLAWTAYSGMRQDRLDRALCQALEEGSVSQVTSLLRQGANPNTRDMRKEPLLSFTSFFGDLFNPGRRALHAKPALIVLTDNVNHTPTESKWSECVRALVDAGANVNVQDISGRTALLYCLQYDDAASVTYLLNHRANPNLKVTDGTNAIFLAIFACDEADPRLLNELTQHGALVDKPNNDGQTPLMIAARVSEAGWVKILLQHGASPKLQDKNGKTALDYANVGLMSSSGEARKNSHQIIQDLKLARAK